MDFIHDVLKKAEQEGKIASRVLSRQHSAATAESKALNKVERDLPFYFLTLPENVLNEIQIIHDNIQALAEQQNLTVIGVASAQPNSGTSLVAATLSVVAARGCKASANGRSFQQRSHNGRDVAEQGVLLLDAQLRNPSAHKIFGLRADAGLSDYLQRNILPGSLINYIPDLHLNVVTAGNESPKYHGQVDTARALSLVKFLKQEFSRVIVDLPPILRFAEGKALAKLCDAVVLVVSSGRSRYPVVEEARRILDDAQVNVLGGIVTRRKFFIPDLIYRWL